MRRRSAKAGLLVAIGAVLLVASSCHVSQPGGKDVAAPTAISSVSSPSDPASPVQAGTQDNSPATPSASTSSSPKTNVLVAPAMPTKLAIPAIGLKIGYDHNSDIRTVVSTHDATGWNINPPENVWKDLQSAYWWSETQYSVLPGDPSPGTTFMFVHACPKVQCAGSLVHTLKAGDKIMVTTSKGVLTYVVTKKLRLDKSVQGIGATKAFYSYGTPNQLRLATCGYTSDGASVFNWAIFATLQPRGL